MNPTSTATHRSPGTPLAIHKGLPALYEESAMPRIPSGRPRGRPRILEDPAIQAKLLDGLRAGLFLKSACKAAGISPVTFFTWRNHWEAGDPASFGLSNFFFRVQETDAKTEAKAIKQLLQGKQGWQAQAWFLERRFPERWARPGSVRRGPEEEEFDDEADLDFESMSDEELETWTIRLGVVSPPKPRLSRRP